jgi:hypothetical protein
MTSGWIALAFVLSQQPAGARRMAAAEPGMWARNAAYLWPGPTVIADAPTGGRWIDVPSPDGSKIVVVRDSSLTLVTAADRTRALGTAIDVQDLAEVLWAPDSRAFAVTESDGGWVAQWSATVYVVEAGSLRRIDSASQALAEFSRRKVSRRGYGCTVEPPNLAAVDWSRGSERLLIVAEAPPHGTCCDLGRLGGYLVDAATGRIIARYGQRDVMRLFHKRLGDRFR